MRTLDATRRAEAINAGWLAYKERAEGLEHAYRKACESWDVLAVVNDDQVIGALFVKAGVVHIGIVPEWRGRWASRGLVREICRHGTKTELLPGEHEQREFVRRFFRIEGIEQCHS